MHPLLLVGLLAAAAPFSSSGPSTLVAGSGPIYSAKDIGAYDSLVPRSVGDRAWHIINSGQVPPFAVASVAPSASSSFLDAVDVDPDGHASTYYLGAPFATPAGITSVAMSVTEKAGAHNTGSNAFGILTLGYVIQGAMAVQTPAASMATYTNTQTITANTVYQAFIAQNQPGYGCTGVDDPIIGDVQVKPVGGSGFWSSDFYRLQADAKTLWYNTRDDYNADGSFNPSPNHSMVLDTDATSIAVEWENTTTHSAPISIGIFVNGRQFTSIAPTIDGNREFGTVALPSGMKRVEIVAGADTDSGAFGGHVGLQLQAVYVPASSTTSVLGQPVTGRRLVLYGDSVISGQGGGVPVFLLQGGPVYLRQRFPGAVFLESWGSRKLSEDITSAGSVVTANVTKLVNWIARASPTDVWLQIGFNDYNNSTLTAAQFATAEGALVDALHARLPNAQIYLQTLGITGLEATANAHGETPPNFRTAQSGLTTGRSWLILVDGTTLYASTDLADTAHLKVGSQATYARAIVSTVDAN